MDIKLIEAGLKKPGKTKSGLADAMRIPNSGVTEMLAGRREVKAREVPVIAEYLELNRVPVVGRIGAGGSIETDFEQGPPEGLDTVDLPFPVPDEMLAFEVSGYSMLPRYDDGDVILVWKEQRRPIESFYGEEAAVRTRDGRRFLKTINQGKGRSVVTLHSFNDKPIENVKLEWIGEIYLTMRKGQLQRLRHREATRERRHAKAHEAAATLELPLKKPRRK